MTQRSENAELEIVMTPREALELIERVAEAGIDIQQGGELGWFTLPVDSNVRGVSAVTFKVLMPRRNP